MAELVYPLERTLGVVTLILGAIVWVALVVGTFGVALLVLAFGFVLYLFAQSALIAHIRGNGVELTEAQFPDLYRQFVACCDRLQIETRPRAYILNGNGVLNAFATKFLKGEFVVLNSNVVDAMEKHEDGARFYIGHELGHLRRKHLRANFLRWPVLWLPLLGAAYSRARESTCDRHGSACCGTPEGATRALAALAAGSVRWEKLDVSAYLRQAGHSSGFWMSFHELIAGYPWLTKRAARVMHPEAALPRRNVFAYLLAVFVPYAGRLGSGFAMLILIYIVAVAAAIALPAYQNYVMRANLTAEVIASNGARAALQGYYESNRAVPESLDAVDVPSQLPDGSELSLDSEHMVLTVATRWGELIFTPRVDPQGRVSWSCANGDGIKPTQLPPACSGMSGGRD